MNRYQIGDRIKLTVTFEADSIPTDPAKVVLQYKNPAGAITSKTYAAAEITKVATGSYAFNLPIPLAVSSKGVWYYRYEALANDDTPLGAGESKFEVEASPFYS